MKFLASSNQSTPRSVLPTQQMVHQYSTHYIGLSDRQKERKTERQGERQGERQKDRQEERQEERQG